MSYSGVIPLVLAGPILRRVEETRVCIWIATSHAARIRGVVFNAAATTEHLGEGKTDTLAFGDREEGKLHIAVVEIKPKAKEFLVFFDLDSATLTPEARNIIAAAATQMKKIRAAQITVTGHTDRSGSEQHNAKLSVWRAETVKAALVKLAIPSAAINIEGKGEKEPAVPTADGVAEARNRRASIAVPIQTFPTRKILAYDLTLELINRNGNVIVRQLLSNLMSSRTGHLLGYKGYSHPTFFIDRDNLNILHGSCRKAHGIGDDALACADVLLEKTASDPTKRPSALFLTGDQIYADDVHDALIKPASELGRQLLGFDEILPKVPAPVHTLSPLWRGKLLAKVFSFDPEVKNHLLGFGDFVGLYLLALNDALWPERLTSPSDDLERFRRALPAVRRALANVATYMIMDDHEVTDDWNFSKDWEERTRKDPLGRRVIAHALCAYWAFQGWGNQPEAFDQAFRKIVVDYFVNRESDGSAFETALLDAATWSFMAPTSPPAFFIDSRTRHLETDRSAAGAVSSKAPAPLLNTDALRDLLTTARAGSGGWFLLIATTPVFGVPVVEQGLERLRYGAAGPGVITRTATFLDLDQWHANRSGYYKLLRVLHEIAPRGGFILSGDVHYAFVGRARVTIGGATRHFVQVTSSALKNRPDTGQEDKLLMLGAADRHPTKEYGWMRAPVFTNRAASQQIRDILSVSPTVATETEILHAALEPPFRFDMMILKGAVRPTTPSDGPCVHRQTNLCQFLTTPRGNATIHFYTPNKADPFASYTFELDASW